MKTNVCYLGDCLEVMKDIPDKSIDLVLTDPPYGIKADSKPIRGKFTHRNLNFDTSIPSKEYFDEIIRISKNQIIWGGNYFAHFLEPRMGWIFWDKELRGFSLADGELAWTSFNKALRVFKQNRPSVRARDGKHHPTQKSVDLMIFCIEYAKKNYKKDISIVLDCFAGSGTTGVACKNLGINCIMIEREEEYCEVIKARTGCDIIKHEEVYHEDSDGSLTEEQQKEIVPGVLKALGLKDICSCGGKLVKTKYGKTCEDCLTDF